MGRTLFAVLMLLLALFSCGRVDAMMASSDVKNVTGKSHPSEDSTFIVSYNNGTVSVQSKSQKVCEDVNVSIRNVEESVLYTCEIPLAHGQTAYLCLPENVDEEKYSLEIECDEEKRLKFYF